MQGSPMSEFKSEPKCFFCEPVDPLENYEPCPECKARMSEGVTIFEVDSAEKLSLPVIIATLAPTRRWFVADETRFKEIVTALKLSDNHIIGILAHRRMFTETWLYEKMLPKESPV
jgi:hypothetical protein